MKKIISFSGGKDSTALILWAKENLDDFEVVFCDTNWEHEITYKFIDYINNTLLDNKLIFVKSKRYVGFEDLCIQRKRVPSVKARFCTQELKLFPMFDYIQEKYSGNVELYIGIRADESVARSKMKEKEYDYVYYGCWVNRPLIRWSADDVFSMHKRYSIDPNPLYKLGFKRVGCFPCIMSRHIELKQMARLFPNYIDRIRNLEKKLGRTFCKPDTIPERFRKSLDKKSGVKIAFIDNVIEYVQYNPDQTELFEPSSCMSHYNICE